MKKRLFALFLALLFVIPSTIMSFAESPTSLEAPQNATARIVDETQIQLRWTIPQSVMNYINDSNGEILYSVDWKVNSGSWQNSGALNTASLEKDEYFHDYLSNNSTDGHNVMEVFFVYYHFGLEAIENLDLVNDTYTFRVRFAYNNYDEPDADYIVSPFSNEVKVGKGAQGVAPTKLDTPTNLKVENKNDLSGKPYFKLSWTNPASVDAADKNVPIEVKVDFKVGNEPWYSEVNGHDWWTGNDYATNVNFDPIEEDIVDRIVIAENTYYFRILYAYEPTYGTKVYSAFSNIVVTGVSPFESASSWAMPDLVDGESLGIITDKIDDKMNGPITREEFAEVAVKFYEVVTGKDALPHPTKTFLDCTNPEVLKAFNLKVTSGASSDGTLFKPNKALTRQEMATMITNTLRACYPEIILDISGALDFKDDKFIAGYAKESTKFMAKYKITVADSLGNFNPVNPCTREQAVAFLVRAFNYKEQYLPK